MNKQKRLLFERTIFLFIIIVSFGIIIFTEKAGGLLIPKAEEIINDYIDNTYKEEKDNFKFGKVTYKNTTYTMKITSKENKNHYFYINYSNKKIKDTYKEDDLKGKNLLNSIRKKLKKEIEEKTNTSCDIKILETLDNYTSTVQNRIIKEDNLLQLKFYTIKKELLINSWNSKDITNKIEKTINTYSNNNITPKNYTIIITNKEDITKSIEISNITEEFINNSSNEKIISDIINDDNSLLLKENKIKYKYLN